MPLIIEQGLEYTVGMAASMMVAQVGESAVSGVSLVDFVMALIISIFAALATGGSVIAGQYLGRKDNEKAKKAANQLIKCALLLSVVITLLLYLFKPLILNHLFGAITKEVSDAANHYFMIVAISVPFLALYNAGAAIFRTMGNAKLPMKIMLIMNIINVAGNALLVSEFHLGMAGVAIPTLISRIGAALIILLSMIFCRIALSYVFAIGFHMGMLGTWVAMFVDWVVKSVIYEWHYKNDKWTRFKTI